MEALGTVSAGVTIWHAVALGVGTLLGMWAAKRAAPAPATLASVVPPVALPVVQSVLAAPVAAHPLIQAIAAAPAGIASTITGLLANPSLMSIVDLLIGRLSTQQQVVAHDVLQTLAVPIAVPAAAPITVTPPISATITK